MRSALLVSTSLVASLALTAVVACSGARSTELEELRPGAVLGADPTSPPEEGSSEPEPGTGATSGGTTSGGTTSGGTNGGCQLKDKKDHDGDGLSFEQGDCNDCNAKVRPGFTDTAGNGVDEDCSGKADDDSALCDTGLALTSASPYDAAKAIGLCKKVTPQSGAWGVLEAKWSKPDGAAITSPESWGLLSKLGSNVAPSGKAMLALSTGAARAPGDVGFVSPTNGYDKNYTHGAPAGQPKTSTACTAVGATPGAPHDGVALALKIRVPLEAKSMSFTHQLFTADTSEYVCTQYNDVFVVMMDPKPAGTDGNVVFDALGNPVGINSASLLRACMPGTFGGLVFACPLGVASLVGTGFDDKAATGWLRTTVPVKGGSDVTLRFAIWDSADGTFDSTVLVDDLSFSAQSAGAPQTIPR